ncbi:GIY-YIG nuclease family protein [Maribellus luteus]|uniref:GIY-YIG nuclease family protein n=1 Tax=Maribellus luteus TaxID=2305463 RepID=A0A399T2V1_9BACT|nr:GIY-YIG nuclease family protein [Maribellus luteus]RIJ49155.1 GIY-YIG nuclease family protein [Maribellus luteus]
MGKKLTVYMIDGTEYGPRIAEIGNWSGKALYATRSTISKVISRLEFENPGIYCLKSEPTKENYNERVYIGEAENIKTRLKQHLSDTKRDFSEIVFFISKDELLTKSHIKYLEARIIQEAKESKSAEIDNGNTPNLPLLHEADIDDMEYFLEQIKLILPIMGFRFLISSVVRPPVTTTTTTVTEKEKEFYFIKTKSFKASMYESDQGYVVQRGSQAKKSLSKSLTDNYRKLRNKLLESDSLIQDGEMLIFSEDTIFNSLSAASNMVLGRQSAGPIQWINSEGKTYKEIQDEKMKND